MHWIANLLGILTILPIALVLYNGHGAGMLAGYNTMPSEQREQYDEKALARAAGIMLLLCCASLALGIPLMLIDGLQSIAMWISWGLFAAVIIGGIIYINTGDRYKKQR